MKKVFYPGSFDPITNGHLDIIKRAYNMFGNINILILSNSTKPNSFFNEEKRKEIIEKIFERENIKGNIIISKKLLVENIEDLKIDVIVRGIRDNVDFNFEFNQNKINMQLQKNNKHKAEFIYLYSTNENSFISSSMIRELVKYGSCISEYVPEEVLENI